MKKKHKFTYGIFLSTVISLSIIFSGLKQSFYGEEFYNFKTESVVSAPESKALGVFTIFIGLLFLAATLIIFFTKKED